jgi:hypothetical protein
MITETAYKNYFENLAAKHIGLAHSATNQAFFYIDNPYELSAIDLALGYMASKKCLLLDVPDRLWDDNASNNYTDKITCQFTILKRESDKSLLLEARNQTMAIVEDFLVKIRQDQSARILLGSVNAKMRIADVKIDAVGPMKLEWYGYTVLVSIICPFSPAVNNGNWLV